MSDSRLEKFIYAICSMDVSDLPVPLSRIEKLWNCLITGETPDFEPLSRNEKYLMAMLDRYDISNLPAPMSRGEKLLYKIAVGETDLSDVPGYLSRYEELLKYLIENGGISGGDFEYVLYTLNQSLYTLYATAEKPVKSAILTGQTLVNLLKVNKDNYVFNQPQNWSIEDGYFKCVSTTSWHTITDRFNNMIKPSTKYLIVVEIKENTLNIDVEFDSYGTALNSSTTYLSFNSNEVGIKKVVITTPSTIDSTKNGLFRMPINVPNEGSILKFRVMAIEYQEGMENWDIPYFEGMQSVKMPVLSTVGKNIFSPTKMTIKDGAIYGYYKYKDDESVRCTLSISDKDTSVDISGIYFGMSKLGKKADGGVEWLISNGSVAYPEALAIITNHNFISIYPNNTETLNKLTERFNIQLEHSEAKTTYEPYKSNILSTPSDLELRGIGDVQDTLDLMTGEVTERIGEIVLDGSEDWGDYSTASGGDDYISFTVATPKLSNRKIGFTNSLCDGMKIITSTAVIDEFIEPHPSNPSMNNWVMVRILKSRLETTNVSGFKKWLSNNPLTLQYELIEKSIKTVDLTVVDQDNQPTQLGTFENVTHVSLEAENLIPEVEMEAATNLLEDTVFNLTSAFNTLYPTAAKPVKSAILTGQTLVNKASIMSRYVDNNEGWNRMALTLNTPLSKNSKYLINVFNLPNDMRFVLTNRESDSNWIMSTYVKEKTVFTPKSDSDPTLVLHVNDGSVYRPLTQEEMDRIQVILIEYQDGMENWDIPYFEGMQSVKMPVLKTIGKNLFDINIFKNEHDKFEFPYKKWKMQLKPNTTYIANSIFTKPNNDTSNYDSYSRIDNGGNFINFIYHWHSNGSLNNRIFTTDDTGVIYLGWFQGNCPYNVWDMVDMQIEEGSTATSYEPHKSNILTVNEEVELRGIGDVKDELDLLTGELTERIGEMVFDGSRDWNLGGSANWNNDGNTTGFYIKYYKTKNNIGYSDKLPLMSNIKTNDTECFYINSTQNWIGIRLSKSKLSNLTYEGLKVYLQSNPVTIQYQLATESIKTVDLTVVDQDGNETKLRTFDDTTHVLLDSEGLIPTAALTVRTKIPSASSTSLLMDDISNEQQQLETTVDEQSENVDATMIATTEIYEETL